MSVACAKTYSVTIAPSCVQADNVFLHAYINFMGGNWNGQLTSQPNGVYQATDNQGNLYLIQKSGLSWIFTINSGGIVYSATGPSSTQFATGPYNATINTMAGVPNQVTFIGCGAAVGRLIYWTFDLAGFQLFYDSFLRIPFVTGNSGPTTVAAKIGNGIEFENGNDSIIADLAIQPQLLNYNQSGFTVAFWVNLSNITGTSNEVELCHLNLAGNDGHEYQLTWGVPPQVFFPPIVFDNAPLKLIKDPNTSSVVLAQVNVPITWTVGQWYFIVLGYDQVSGTISASVNAGQPSVSAGSAMLPTGNWDTIDLSPLLNTGPPAGNFILDEYMVHTGKLLNSTQIQQLFNSGNGVTWPQAGIIVE